MNQEYIQNLWERAVTTLGAAKMTISFHQDTAANRAYYAAFHAVSALFADENKYFKKHTGLRSAVHKELVNTGRWTPDMGDDYDELMKLRDVADYGATKHVLKEDAEEAIIRAERIVMAVHEAKPDIFKLPIENE
jgi:uncharacterized protein